MPEVHRVADVDEAIDLASRFRDEGRYDWFRGQVRAEWLPHSSLMRIQLRDTDWETAHGPRFARFCSWLANTPGLAEINNDRDAIFAVAQHYGLPTHYIDFTTDPAVAGFFAADTDSPPQPSVESCILCLDIGDLMDTWATIREAVGPEDGPVVEIEPVRPRVANLWRLQAQKGVFLYAPTNWEVHYPMDRIVFPYRGYPAFPTKKDIYPDHKSQLEILLDQFFDNERKLEGNKALRAFFEEVRQTNPNVSWSEAESRPLGYLPSYVRSGHLEPHASWTSAVEWHAIVEEDHATVLRREVPIALDLTAQPSVLAGRFAKGVGRAMERDSSLRRHAVTWRLEVSASVSLRPSLGSGLSSLWNGLRRLPIEDSVIATALGNWLAFYKAGVDTSMDVGAQMQAFAEVLGPSLRVEFGAPDGSSAIGVASESGLQASLRPDLRQLLSEDVAERSTDLRFLLQIITSPNLLFDFRKLADLFVAQIAPSQMTQSPPHFFHPARLGVFGLP